jgi:hypothetical protein
MTNEDKLKTEEWLPDYLRNFAKQMEEYGIVPDTLLFSSEPGLIEVTKDTDKVRNFRPDGWHHLSISFRFASER